MRVGDKVFTTDNDFVDITSVVRVDEELEKININCEPYDVYFRRNLTTQCTRQGWAMSYDVYYSTGGGSMVYGGSDVWVNNWLQEVT